MFPSTSRRHLAVWCPQLPLDRLSRREDPRLWGAFAVTRQQGGAERVLVANDIASQAGVRPGQSLTNAVAVCPDLLSEPQDDARDRRLLMALHAWSDRFSPRVAPETPDSLVMDVTGWS